MITQFKLCKLALTNKQKTKKIHKEDFSCLLPAADSLLAT